MNAMVVVSYALFLGLLYMLLIYPKNKQAKKIHAMRESLKAGDEIVTIGGTVGRIKNIYEDEIVFETGPDGTTIKVKKWAVGSMDVKKIEQGV